MSRFIGVLFILLTFGPIVYSQTTICEKNTILYFSCYKLRSDQTFSYQYIDGSGEKIGIGTYTKDKKQLIFEYDSLVSPIINRSKDANSLEKIHITCSYILDSFPRLFHPVVYNKKVFFCDSLGQVIIPNYTDGSILIHNYVDSIFINPKLLILIVIKFICILLAINLLLKERCKSWKRKENAIVVEFELTLTKREFRIQRKKLGSIFILM